MSAIDKNVRVFPYEQAVLNEIEGVVYTHPDVVECAAVGVILRRELRD